MKCAYHNDVDAVATCNVCGVGLCSTCAKAITPPQCIHCYRDGLVNSKDIIRNALIKDVAFAIIALVAGFLFMTRDNVPVGEVWGSVLLCVGVPFGWGFLNKITPNVFLFLPMIGWVIYFVFKLALSMIVGIFVTPYVIWKKIKDMKQIQQLIDNTGNMRNEDF